MSLSDEEGHLTCIDSLLTTKERGHLEALLCPNADIFAWTHLDMPRIDSSMATHKLNIILNMCPMRQKVWSFHLDSQKVIQKKIDKLLVVGFIWEVTYPNWLANIVVVLKNWGT